MIKFPPWGKLFCLLGKFDKNLRLEQGWHF